MIPCPRLASMHESSLKALKTSPAPDVKVANYIMSKVTEFIAKIDPETLQVMLSACLGHSDASTLASHPVHVLFDLSINKILVLGPLPAELTTMDCESVVTFVLNAMVNSAADAFPTFVPTTSLPPMGSPAFAADADEDAPTAVAPRPWAPALVDDDPLGEAITANGNDSVDVGESDGEEEVSRPPRRGTRARRAPADRPDASPVRATATVAAAVKPGPGRPAKYDDLVVFAINEKLRGPDLTLAAGVAAANDWERASTGGAPLAPSAKSKASKARGKRSPGVRKSAMKGGAALGRVLKDSTLRKRVKMMVGVVWVDIPNNIASVKAKLRAMGYTALDSDAGAEKAVSEPELDEDAPEEVAVDRKEVEEEAVAAEPPSEVLRIKMEAMEIAYGPYINDNDAAGGGFSGGMVPAPDNFFDGIAELIKQEANPAAWRETTPEQAFVASPAAPSAPQPPMCRAELEYLYANSSPVNAWTPTRHT